MQKHQLESLCNKYNDSDYLAFLYLVDNDLCTPSQLKEIHELLELNYCLCCNPGYLTNEEEYHTRTRKLLADFGVSFTLGDAFAPSGK